MSRGVTFSEASRQEGSDRLREEERALADVGGESTQVVLRVGTKATEGHEGSGSIYGWQKGRI